MKLVLIVNGIDVDIKAKKTNRLATVRNSALKLSNNIGRPHDDWEVHSAAGEPLDVRKTVGKLGLEDGARIFLNRGVGAGG